ncbi:hypothetical protein [Clostridium aminobutyricum]|uniref:Uncharacterized protein n=1 Tax=Clostridium aminobutyricum TaxID=33953 RepID=A0A939IGI4_CLOAM|nr:hypothetical protein [Clostridium aminobutyricum]MBN7771972.1 hypothetical protein [Clostridium aminobutyricum]
MSGGAHIVFRKSPAQNIFNAVSSDLTVPTDALASYPNPNDASYNTVPEFFHVFYNGVYTIDAGVAYENNGYYRLFANINGTWHSGPLAKATGTKTLKSWFSAEGTNRYIVTQFGSVVDKAPISTTMYNSLNKGSQIYREMVIASNAKSTIPANAYYKNAKFANTTLTNVNGTYVALDSKSTCVLNKLDPNVSQSTFDTYCKGVNTPSGTTFVSDTSSASFNQKDSNFAV